MLRNVAGLLAFCSLFSAGLRAAEIKGKIIDPSGAPVAGAQVAAVNRVGVIARTTASTYKGKSVDAKQMGRDLGVRFVIEGSVRRSGNQVQVNVQLIDAETGAHLWADRFDTDRTNLTEAQNEITGRLAKTLNVELFQAASRRIEQERAADPDARDFAMRAWARVLRGPLSPATFEEALRLNRRALEIDPGSVDAKINMASILDGYLSNGWSRSIQQDQEQKTGPRNSPAGSE